MILTLRTESIGFSPNKKGPRLGAFLVGVKLRTRMCLGTQSGRERVPLAGALSRGIHVRDRISQSNPGWHSRQSRRCTRMGMGAVAGNRCVAPVANPIDLADWVGCHESPRTVYSLRPTRTSGAGSRKQPNRFPIGLPVAKRTGPTMWPPFSWVSRVTAC